MNGVDWARVNDGQYHTFCLACGQEGPVAERRQGRAYFDCRACGAVQPRALIIDPEVKWWTDEAGEYWHESAGVFVCDSAGAFLFFERLKYPWGLTVPAGHLAFGEDPMEGARRELGEEVGLEVERLVTLGIDDIWGDECRRGANVHRWHSYGARLGHRPTVTVVDEGERPVWLRLDEALAAPLTPATRYVIERHQPQLQRLSK